MITDDFNDGVDFDELVNFDRIDDFDEIDDFADFNDIDDFAYFLKWLCHIYLMIWFVWIRIKKLILKLLLALFKVNKTLHT